MFDILLQADTLTKSTETAAQVESVWSLLSKGGPLMIPLGILFALAVFFFIERLLAVKKASKIETNFMNIIRDHIVGLVLLLKQFATISNPSVSQIADAMYIKLITSASGLIIGMLAYLGYSYLDTQINRTANRMEAASSEFIDILQEPTK